MATRVYESRVIPVPIEKVWATIRALDLKWLDTVKNVESNGGAGEVGSELGARRMLPESTDRPTRIGTRVVSPSEKPVYVAGGQPEEGCFQGRNSAGQATVRQTCDMTWDVDMT